MSHIDVATLLDRIVAELKREIGNGASIMPPPEEPRQTKLWVMPSDRARFNALAKVLGLPRTTTFTRMLDLAEAALTDNERKLLAGALAGGPVVRFPKKSAAQRAHWASLSPSERREKIKRMRGARASA